jgi:general secretion pathway protein H
MVPRAVKMMTLTSTGNTRQNSRLGQRGFTLLELLVVMTLIVIVGALILPNLATTDNSAFNAQLRRAVATLTYARRVAIVESSPQMASFHVLDPGSADYAARLQALADNGSSANWTGAGIDLRFQYEAGEPAAAVDSIDITFFPQGGSTGGVLTLSLGERSARIRVDPITGRIATALGSEDFDDAI